MKLETDDSVEDKQRWRIIRTDFCGPNGGEVEGQIVSADEENGECSILIAGEIKSLSFGPGGIRIVGRRR